MPADEEERFDLPPGGSRQYERERLSSASANTEINTKINQTAANDVSEYLESDEHIMWADVSAKNAGRGEIIWLFGFFSFWQIMLWGMTVKSIIDGQFDAILTILMFSVFGFVFSYLNYLNITGAAPRFSYALTNKHGLIVKVTKIDFFGKNLFDKTTCFILNRDNLRKFRFEGDDKVGTLTFRGNSIEHGKEPFGTILDKYPNSLPKEFKNISDAKYVVDLIRLHFFGDKKSDEFEDSITNDK